MSLTSVEAELPEASADLVAEVETRKELRRAADKAEFRVALHDMAEGLRGLIRVAPFASIGLAAALGRSQSADQIRDLRVEAADRQQHPVERPGAGGTQRGFGVGSQRQLEVQAGTQQKGGEIRATERIFVD